VKFIDWSELDTLLADESKMNSYTVLDVTEEMERMVFAVPNSIHIPSGQIHDRWNELDKNKMIILYCTIGVRSYNAARVLIQKGFKDVSVLSCGTSFYKSMHYEKSKVQLKAAEKKTVEPMPTSDKEMKVLNCCGLQCPGPIMKVHETISGMNENEMLKVSATDMGFAADIDSWCRRTGNTLVKTERQNKENIVYIKKGTENMSQKENQIIETPQGKTIIVFSGDLDKVLASFIIANGAASMGRPVTMFFTFWGLNALRKSNGPSVKKPFMDRMFGAMMPKGSKKLKLSKMNMAGIACTMSMDIMGITKDELIDGVEFAGVASYLGDAEESNVNLFI